MAPDKISLMRAIRPACEPGWKSKNRARQDCFGD
jgi:hypothetical protein